MQIISKMIFADVQKEKRSQIRKISLSCGKKHSLLRVRDPGFRLCQEGTKWPGWLPGRPDGSSSSPGAVGTVWHQLRPCSAQPCDRPEPPMALLSLHKQSLEITKELQGTPTENWERQKLIFLNPGINVWHRREAKGLLCASPSSLLLLSYTRNKAFFSQLITMNISLQVQCCFLEATSRF